MSQQNLGNPLLSSTYQKMEPFLWIHLALLAAVPLALVLCMMGLAVGDPIFPGWLEMLVLGIPPIALTVWLQWQNPLYPFSLWVLAKPATELSDDRRRVLSVLRRRINGWYIGAWIAVVAGLFMYVVFRQIYIAAPLAADMAPFPPALRLLGILWAEVFLLVANLLWQMGVAAARVMLVPSSEFNGLAPYEVDRISKEFTILGKRSPGLLSLEPLAPIQQTAELITEPNASEPASTNPLLAQLSGLIDKVIAFLPGGKSATVERPVPVRSPESQATEEKGEAEEIDRSLLSDRADEGTQVEEIEKPEEVEGMARTGAPEETEETEDAARTEQTEAAEEIKAPEETEETEDTARTEQTEAAEEIKVPEETEETEDTTRTEQTEAAEEIKVPEETEETEDAARTEQTEAAEEIKAPEETEEIEKAKQIVTVDTLTADLSDALTQSGSETNAQTEPTPENSENIDSGETTIEVASDAATAEATNQGDRSDSTPNPNSDDEEWV
ncbi:low-complexity tail membrane protein [Pseudanabaena sp. PCC 6802]|uniref:low-complexity tail membrane protein n=1 Tax=Pseudanabaena sp. PCC 6802 TaxID=118173 RepID=UPI0003461627|nr:low-complexity tail membrane protein [Pseudanabaena sp. PCC 6802]